MFVNQEKENYIQSKLNEIQLSDKNFQSNNQGVQQKPVFQQQQSNPFQMISFLQQQQQSSKLIESKPQITKNLPNAKTLEEIENELLNQPNCSNSKHEPNDNYKNQSMLCQQQQLDLSRFTPFFNMNQYQTQQNLNSNDLQNLRQLQQKQLLQAWLIQQNSQQKSKLIQQQAGSAQNQTSTNNLNDLCKIIYLFLLPNQIFIYDFSAFKFSFYDSTTEAASNFVISSKVSFYKF